jgi:hypothetical protein
METEINDTRNQNQPNTQESDYPDISGVQFKKLINLTKLLGGGLLLAITFLSTVAIFVTHGSLRDLKTDLKNETKEVRADFDRYLSYSTTVLERVNEDSREEIKRVNRASVDQVDQITKEALFQAKTSSTQAVKSYLNDDKELKRIVRNTAEQILGEFEKEVEVFTMVLPDIFIAVERISRSDRAGLDTIISLINNSNNTIVVESAKKILNEKREDYSKAYNPQINSFWGENLTEFFRYLEEEAEKGKPRSGLQYISYWDVPGRAKYLKMIARLESWIKPDKTQLVKELIYSIQVDQNLDAVAMAHFLVLEMTDINCELFDFDAFKKASESYTIKSEYINK